MHQPLDLPIMVLNVFIDTEFTDFVNPQLISIGLAAASGEVFYAEVPYSGEQCSTFVRDVVLPLLGRVPHTECATAQVGQKMIDWLEEIRRDAEVRLCFDFQTDWDLFVQAIGHVPPSWCTPRLISSRNINALRRYAFYKHNNFPEHHALYDAMAARHAFRERN